MSATCSRRSPAPDRVDQTARDLLDLLGGEANIQHFTYCFTKLRLSLVHRAAADDTALLAHPAVMGLIEHDTYQVMLGPAVVEHIAHALDTLLALGRQQ
jgi:PTS system sucrose-specific IIC component